ncbi:MAG: hypothetical protein HQ568_05920 [Calditrichaeota bacterium]|nr:hypothetical protein [Calditrichota bacterium]
MKILITTILLFTTSLQAYQVNIEFLAGEPMIFSIGSFIQGDMSEASDINFDAFEPFFTIEVTAEDDDNPPENLILLIRMQAQDGDVLFTVRSDPFDITHILGRPIDNQALNFIPNIGLGRGNNAQIDGRHLMTNYLNGQNFREGFYTFSVLLSDSRDWDTAISPDHNRGIASKSLHVFNPSNVDLIEPMDRVVINENPTFVWSFPAEEGVTFHIEMANADPDEEPVNAIEFANPQNIYADFYMKPAQWQLGGNLTSYSYTGNRTGVEEVLDFTTLRQLDSDKTYFWRITARVPTMFPNEYEEIRSPVYSFDYSSSAGNNEGGDLNLSGGSQEEDPTPDQEHAIFNVLRDYLTEAQINTLSSLLGDLSNWDLQSIRIAEQQITVAEIARMLSEDNISILTVSVSE